MTIAPHAMGTGMQGPLSLLVSSIFNMWKQAAFIT